MSVSEKILTITGASGSGKSTIARILTEEFSYRRVVTCTSRPPREREQDGIDYHFRNRDVLLGMKERGELLAPTEFAGNIYGIPASEFEDKGDGKFPVVVLDTDGVREMKEKFRDKVFSAYIRISPKEALRRMTLRDGEEAAMKRQESDKQAGLFLTEENAFLFDLVVPNNKSATAARKTDEALRKS